MVSCLEMTRSFNAGNRDVPSVTRFTKAPSKEMEATNKDKRLVWKPSLWKAIEYTLFCHSTSALASSTGHAGRKEFVQRRRKLAQRQN